MTDLIGSIPPIPTVIVAALITLLGTFLIQRLLAKRAHLAAEISAYKLKRPEVLDALVWKYKDSEKSIPEAFQQKLRHLDNIESFVEILLHNRSKKRIEGVTIIVGSKGIYQVGDERTIIWRGTEDKTLVIPDDRKILLGDLHPNQKMIINIWTTLYLVHDFASLRERFVITAHEFDKLSFKCSVPPHLSSRYFLIRRLLVWVGLWVLLIGVWLLVVAQTK